MKQKYLIKNPFHFPPCLRDIKEVMGISVGGCVDQDDIIDKKSAAHAHTMYKYTGWICLSRKSMLKERLLLLHEAAHLLVDESGHGKEWRKAVVSIGGTYKSYTYVHWYRDFIYPDYTYGIPKHTKSPK